VIASALFLFGIGGAIVSAVASGGTQNSPSATASGSSAVPGDALLSSKLAAIRSEDDARSSAALTAAPKPSYVAPSPDVVPPRTSEIVESHQSPLGADQFEVENAWSGPSPIAGQWWVVYAGTSLAGGVRTPAVAVYAEPADPNDFDQYLTEVGVFDNALAVGPLQIEATSGTTLTLAAAAPAGDPTTGSSSGAPSADSPGPVQQLTFDLSSKEFSIR
jgi:hypothetical protein